MSYKEIFSIYNAVIVTSDKILENGSLIIEDGKIAEISTGKKIIGEKAVNANGNYVIPGFIDMHSDAIEKEIEARPGTYLATNIAILELDKKLTAAGVTTMYHSVSFADEVIIVIRSLDVVTGIIREIKRLQDKLLVNTMVHARYEITYTHGFTVIEKLINEGLIDLISIMDHTPGQGQFKTEEQIRGYYGDRFGVDNESIKNLVETRMNIREKHGFKNAEAILKVAKKYNIPIASHDDDSKEKIIHAKNNGMTISEFPVTMEAVQEAFANGIHIALGAPNILRGYSHNKNLSARDLIKNGYGDIVCSDYIPSTLLYAFFSLVDNKIKTMTEAAHLFSTNPAKALGINNKTGAIKKGLDCDLLLIQHDNDLPRIKKTFVKGREVYSVCID